MTWGVAKAAIVAFAVAGIATSTLGRRWTPPIETTTGIPTSIYDGDTFRIGAIRVRIWGVDAPELETRFGPSARAQLVRLTANRRVTCRDTGKRSYDRIVAQCWNWRGQDIAAAMARSGWAVDWPSYSRGRYQIAQQAAQRDRAGVFRYGVHPWR